MSPGADPGTIDKVSIARWYVAADDREVVSHLVWRHRVVRCCGVTVSVYTATGNTSGHFHTSLEREFNTFAFFTIQSNLIVGATSLLLALRPERSSPVFATFRLIGVVAITVTGVIYHVALASIFDLQGWQLGNQLVHTVVPVLAVVGWFSFGPRSLTSARIARWSLLFPIGWLAFTLIRGAVVKWYPYPFIDVTKLGYGGAVLNSSGSRCSCWGWQLGSRSSIECSIDLLRRARRESRRSPCGPTPQSERSGVDRERTQIGSHCRLFVK